MRRELAIALLAATACAGCGLNVQSPDLFVLTRTGQGTTLRLLVNDAGTVRCNGGPARALPGPQLLAARDLATTLNADAQTGLHIAPGLNTVYRYTVQLQAGTITFPDTAGSRRHELAQAELFALQAEKSCK